jgi:hypothetical protein
MQQPVPSGEPIIPNSLLDPFLEALVLTGVHPELIMHQAEALGAGPERLLQIAGILTGTADPVPGMALALGSIREWPVLRPQALALGSSLLTRLVRFFVFRKGTVFPCNQDGTKAWLPDDARWDGIRIRALRRLGYPRECIPKCAIPLDTDEPVIPEPDAWAWMDAGNDLVASSLELEGGASRAREWGPLLVARIVLKDCQVPAILHRPDVWLPSHQSIVRLCRVSGLREFIDDCLSTTLVAVGCPDLMEISSMPRSLVVKDCPSLSRIAFKDFGHLLHLERCPGITSLSPVASARTGLPRGMGGRTPSITYGHLVLAECPNLDHLPGSLRVQKNMTLRRMGPFLRWPVHFEVDGDLRIRDCPLIEELPRVTVGGSLRVAGRSGLRRLLPGSGIGGDLDLRACASLEGLPQDLNIGGALRLPGHLCFKE